jgi:hypothetical protein
MEPENTKSPKKLVFINDNTDSGSHGPQFPLKMMQTFNMAILLTFYSPIIIIIGVVSIAFAFNKAFKGIFYVMSCLVVTFFRDLLLNMFQSDPNVAKADDICTMVQYSYGSYGNSTFTMFFMAFSAVYICAPMIINGVINYGVLAGFLFYFGLDLGIRYHLKCVQKISDILFNTFFGAMLGFIFMAGYYMTNTQDFLFFNETGSTKDMCSMPSKQTFKCSVYKNGELIGSTNAPTST